MGRHGSSAWSAQSSNLWLIAEDWFPSYPGVKSCTHGVALLWYQSASDYFVRDDWSTVTWLLPCKNREIYDCPGALSPGRSRHKFSAVERKFCHIRLWRPVSVRDFYIYGDDNSLAQVAFDLLKSQERHFSSRRESDNLSLFKATLADFAGASAIFQVAYSMEKSRMLDIPLGGWTWGCFARLGNGRSRLEKADRKRLGCQSWQAWLRTDSLKAIQLSYRFS